MFAETGRPLNFMLEMSKWNIGEIKTVIKIRFLGIHLFFHAKAGTELQSDYNYFLPHRFQFIIH
jgi:hypothetical protein